MENQIKGSNYEIQVRDYIINNLNNNAYLWKDIPENILIDTGIINSHNQNRIIRKENKENPIQDTGIDLIQIDSNNKYILIQCKNGYKNGITMQDLSGFMCWMVSLDTLKGCVYYTNKLSNSIKNLPITNRVEYIKHEYITNENDIKYNKNIYKPHEYQKNAVNKFNIYFENNKRGILSMPCGTGKTYTSFLISKKYDQIIILSPLRQFARQNLDKYIEYGYKNKSLLVNSDGERDIDLIREFILNNKKFLISSTFFSIDVIEQCLQYMKNPLIIIDEFHNISKTNLVDSDDYFYKLLYSNNKILFMSATPKIYEIDYDEYNVNDIFGSIFYSMTFTDAISNNYITDYRIWLPSINEDNNKLNNELSIYDISDIIKSKCNFLFLNLLNNGSKKCIIYCVDIDEINNIINGLNILNDFYCIEYEYDYITSDVNETNRLNKLKKFEQSERIQLLFSVRILDECIDIPSCDSIYITYTSASKIRTIQRLSRCIRIDKNNKFKIGNIYLWCDKYDKILDTLSGIKEYDINFIDKIKVSESNFYGNSIKDNYYNDIKLVKKYVLDIKEYKVIDWTDKLKWVMEYIDKNKKRPSIIDKNKLIKQYGNWLSNQLQNYNNLNYIMKNKIIFDKFTEFINNDKYKKYFISSEEQWNNYFKWVIEYIDINKKRPSKHDKNEDIKKYGVWISTQQKNFKNKTESMKILNIYNTWNEFINSDEYKKYFISDKDEWYIKLDILKEYIENNNKRPSTHDDNDNIVVIARWLSQQINNYKNNLHSMKIIEIKEAWEDFINNDNIKKYIISWEDEWFDNLDHVKKYYDLYNQKLPVDNKYRDWLYSQIDNYSNNKHNMKNQNIKDAWEIFIKDNKYKKFINNYNDIWLDKFNWVKKYIEKNNIRPFSNDNNNEIMMYGKWLVLQKMNYKLKKGRMKDLNIYNKWTSFINDDKYKKYLI